MIAIVDYGAGNLKSVQHALEFLKVESVITGSPDAIQKASRLILPGDGSFGFMMETLKKKKLIEPIKAFLMESLRGGRPFLGICLGLQGLFQESEESPGIKGLSIFKGSVKKFRDGKVPQIGWNRIVPKKKGIFKEEYMYFVNSYAVAPKDPSIVATETDYFGNFVSSVQLKNITAMQFHPEKSGKGGIDLLKRWLAC
ncbi:imidazole glycerol phosphate synthase subunit HisH [Candidatus Woesearchaeota archaeon]|nr:imidazole glycerol phosphate synthase subunit HisH [Candidatus Woesearchaeota archaeon]